MLSAGEFVGEGALAAVAGLRLSTATAITDCTTLKIWRREMVRLMHDERGFSELFMKYLIESSMRVQADLVDHLFNLNVKRLARILLMMAEYGEPGEPVEFIMAFIPRSTSESCRLIETASRADQQIIALRN